MGERQSTLFRPEFNRSIEVEAREERLSGDAGVLVLREVFSSLGMDEFFKRHLIDPRYGPMVTHPQIEMLRTHLLLLAQGHQDQNDAAHLYNDPMFRLSVSERGGTGPLQAQPEGSLVPNGLPSQPTLSRLVHTLSFQRWILREALMTFAGRRIRTSQGGHRMRYATLDVDSFPLEVFGDQEGSSYNGYYGFTCYHPLVASIGESGDLLDVELREGNAHTAEGGLEFILPLLDEMEKHVCQVASVRMDAGFPEDKLLSALEQRDVGYVARIRKNLRLDRLAQPYLETTPDLVPDGEDRHEFHELRYQADSWSHSRRIVLVIRHSPTELFPEYFFLLTNWSQEQMPGIALLDLYRQRGTAEGHYGEFKSVLQPALSSSRRPKSHYRGQEPQQRSAHTEPFAANEVKLLLNALAYNLLHAVRCLIEGPTRKGWGLGRTRERLLKIPARVLLHSRRITVVIERSVAGLWKHLIRALERFRWRAQTVLG